jgi:hypothetical protein
MDCPWIMGRGLPGKRVEAYLAGIIPIIDITNYKSQK